MATLEKAEALLEELRSASYDAAVRELEEVKAFAAAHVRARHMHARPWLVACTAAPAQVAAATAPALAFAGEPWRCAGVLLPGL